MTASSLAIFLASALLTSVFAVGLTQFRPILACVYVIALEILGPSFPIPHTSLNLAKVALISVVLTLVITAVSKRSEFRATLIKLQGARWRHSLLVLGVLGLLVITTGLTVFTAQYHGAVWRETAKAAEYLVIAVLGILSVRTYQDRAAFIAFFAVISGVVALLALSQEWTGTPSVFIAGAHVIPRISGPLEGPNQLAAYLGIFIPIVFAWEVFSRRRSRNSLLFAFTLGICMVADILTFSRSGIITNICTLALIWFLRPHGYVHAPSDLLAVPVIPQAPNSGRIPPAASLTRRPLPAVLSSAGLAAMGVSLGAVVGFAVALTLAGPAHFLSLNDAGPTGAVGHRSELWKAAIEFWQRSPVLGIGAGNFERELASVGLPLIHTHANSIYLQALAEGGVLLCAVTIATIVIPLWLFARAYRRSRFSLGTFAAGIALALHQVVDTLTFYPKIGLVWWLVVGLSLSSLRHRLFDRVPAAERG